MNDGEHFTINVTYVVPKSAWIDFHSGRGRLLPRGHTGPPGGGGPGTLVGCEPEGNPDKIVFDLVRLIHASAEDRETIIAGHVLDCAMVASLMGTVHAFFTEFYFGHTAR